MKVLATTVAALLLVTIGIWLAVGERDHAATAPAGPDEASLASPGIEAAPSTPREEAMSTAREALPSHEPGALVTGIVLGPSGKGIPGAALTLTVLARLDLDCERSWRGNDWGPLDRTVLRTTADAEGRFELRPPPTLEHGAVLWATHAGHMAGCALIETAGPAALRIVLEEAEPVTVLVRDARGAPVVGAQVRHFGLAAAALAPDAPMDEARARRFLRAEGTTGADGTVTLARFPERQALEAVHDGQGCAPWVGVPHDLVVLDLTATFELAGEVFLPDWSHLDYEGERRIVVTTQEANLRRPLAVVREVEEGPWGPIRLPLLDVPEYRVRLEGSPIVPVDVALRRPAPGERVTLDLAAELGTDLWFQVTDTDGEVIPHSIVRVSWPSPANPERWSFVERGPYFRGLPNDGLTNLWGVPRGPIRYEASAEGHVTVRSPVVDAGALVGYTVPLVLEEAARVSGRVLHRGEPVEDFEVFTWRTEARDSHTATSFHDRSDGRFELDTVPAGDCWISACSATLPGCDPVQIRTAAGETAEVVIELPDAVLGAGIVVDEDSGEPVQGASVQLFVPGDLAPLARWGDPVPVGADGVFELERFRPGTNAVRVSAPGYSRRNLQDTAPPGEIMDWGTIALARAHELVVVLEDEGSGRLIGTSISGRGAQTLAPRKVERDGTVTFTEASSGLYELTIEEPGGTTTDLRVDLAPGRDWRIRHALGGPRRVSVGVETDDPSRRQRLLVSVSWQSARGYVARRSIGPIPRDVVEFEGIDGDAVQVELLDERGRLLDSVSGSFEGESLHLELSTEGEPFELHVVDTRGEPVSDARVLVADPLRNEVELVGSTDAGGTCELRGVPPRELLVDIRHARGSHFGIPIDASTGEAEVVFDADASIRLRVLDGQEPLRAVEGSLVDVHGRPLQLDARTDEAGLVEWPNLGRGTYLVRLRRTDCWPVSLEVEADQEAIPLEVQMRRRGDLELLVVQFGGLPVSGAPVELTSIELGVDVAKWLDEGLVESEGLVSDFSGRLVVRGLPRGPYRWRIPLGDGNELTGEVQVRVGPSEPAVATIPR